MMPAILSRRSWAEPSPAMVSRRRANKRREPVIGARAIYLPAWGVRPARPGASLPRFLTA